MTTLLKWNTFLKYYDRPQENSWKQFEEMIDACRWKMSKGEKSLASFTPFSQEESYALCVRRNLRRVIPDARKQRPGLLPRLKIGGFSATLAI